MKMVTCGWRHTIVVSEAGNIYSYGWSKYGQLGHGTFQDLLVPHQVLVLNDRKIESVCYVCLIDAPYLSICLRTV